MLSWGSPGALWLLFALIPIGIFYFLRTRFQRQPISSIYIWTRLQQAIRGGSRLRWWSILLLLLQIGTALAAVAAAARPAWLTRRLSQPGTVFLLDVSASMAGRESGRSRIEEARALAAEEIGRLPAGTQAAIFLCGADAVLWCGPTADRGRLLSRLRDVQAGSAGFNESAVAGTIQAWLTAQDGPWQAHLISDGGLDLGGRQLSSVFGGALRYAPVGRTGANLGVTGLRLLAGSRAQFHVYNGWPERRRIKVRLERDGRLLAEAQLTAAPGLSRHALAFPGPSTAGGYTLRLDMKHDALAVDDQAYLAVEPARPRRILLAGPYDPFLRAALRRPGFFLSTAASFPPGFTGQGWDLLVASRVPVPAGIRSHLLCFGQVPPDGPVRLGGPAAGELLSTDSIHPLARYLDWEGAGVAEGRALIVQPGTQILATAGGAPILAAWESSGWRCAVWGTTTFDSELGLSGAFPIFLQNYLQWCFPELDNALAHTLTVGEPALLAEPQEWRVAAPAVRLVRRGPQLEVTAQAPGLFPWRRGGAKGWLAANPPGAESELAPRALALDPIPPPLAAQYTSGRRDLVEPALIVMLLCLSVEWWIWRGGWRGRPAETPGGRKHRNWKEAAGRVVD